MDAICGRNDRASGAASRLSASRPVVASPRRADLKAVDDQIRRYDLPLCHLFTLDKLGAERPEPLAALMFQSLRFMRPETFASSMNSLMYASHLCVSLGYGHGGIDVSKTIAQNARTRQRSGLGDQARAVQRYCVDASTS